VYTSAGLGFLIPALRSFSLTRGVFFLTLGARSMNARSASGLTQNYTMFAASGISGDAGLDWLTEHTVPRLPPGFHVSLRNCAENVMTSLVADDG